MKIPIIPLCMATLLAVVAGITNPDNKKFEIFITEKDSRMIKEQYCQTDSNSILEKFVNRTCNLITETGIDIFSQWLKENTIRHNYILFSIYEINSDINHSIGGSKTIGIFNNFIVLDHKK